MNNISRIQRRLMSGSGIFILSLPERYDYQDIITYLDGKPMVYLNCNTLCEPEALYHDIKQALSSDITLCLDHINRLTQKSFWEKISQSVWFMLDPEDYTHSSTGFLEFSRIKLLLTCSEEEFNDCNPDTNLLQFAVQKGALKFNKQ